MVPKYAYSAGTLLCFSGNEIVFGHTAGLSPIDITLQDEHSEVQLASIDGFLDFSDACQRHIQRVLGEGGIAGACSVGSDVLCQMVGEVGALKVGEYYRARTLTGHYAEELLDRYMLKGVPNGHGIAERIIRELLFSKPVHEFHVDYDLCADMGLVVDRMPTEVFDATRNVVGLLDEMTRQGQICHQMNDQYRMPFIGYFKNSKPAGGSK